MDLDALGNVGDFLGGVGVVVTLVYLAAQIRQNTAQLRANAESLRIAALDETQRSISHWRESIIRQRDVADLWERGMSPEQELDPTDRIRFELLLGDLLYSWQAAFRRARHAGDPEHWETGMHAWVNLILTRPGPRKFWERMRSVYFADFAAEIDRILSTRGPAV